MRSRLAHFACVSLIVSCAQALRHIPLVGLSQQLSLEFLGFDKADAPASLISLSHEGILARLQPNDGSVMWRQYLNNGTSSTAPGNFQVDGDQILSVFANSVARWAGTSGFMEWSRNFEQQVRYAYFKQDQVVVITPTNLYMLSRESGETEGSIDIDDALMIFSVNTAAKSPSYVSYMSKGHVHVKSLDDTSSKEASYKSLGSIVIFPTLNKLAFLSDANAISTVCLDKHETFKGTASTSDPYVSLQSLDALISQGYFMAIKKSKKASILRFKSDTDCTLEIAWDFSDTPSEALYTGSIDRFGQVYVTRLTFNPYIALGTLSTYSAAHEKVQGSTFPYSQAEHGRFLTGTTEAALAEENSETMSPSGPAVISRSIWLTATGSLQMWFGGGQAKPEWTRSEGLSTIQKVTWYDDSVARIPTSLPKIKEGMIGRWNRHTEMLLNKTTSLITDFDLITSYFSPSQWLEGNIKKETDETDWLTTSFGFHKSAITASERGLIYGLDLMKDASEYLRWQSRAIEVASLLETVDWLFLECVLLNEQPLVIGVATVHKETTETVFVRLDARSGAILEQRVLFPGAPSKVFPVALSIQVPIGGMAILDQKHKAYLIPLDKTMSPVTPFLPYYYFVQESPKLVNFYTVDWNQASRISANWRLPISNHESIHSIEPLTHSPIASIGKVRADRSVLYKYLNPHLILITTYNSASKSASFYLVDSVSSHTIWQGQAQQVDIAKGVRSLVVENWVTIVHVDLDGSPETSRILSVELYEDIAPKTKRVSAFNSSAFEITKAPVVFSRTFVLPYHVRSLAFTQSRLGVSTKALLITTNQDSLISVQRRFLDPRRPMAAKPSKSDVEELLLPYTSLISIDPKQVLSKSFRLYPSRHTGLSATSTLLESTSLVLSYGLDLLAVKVAPSSTFDVLSQDFNKIQLLGTIIALTIGCAVLKPIVDSKRLKSRWYTT